YMVGLRMTDSNQVTQVAVLYVTVDDALPEISAGDDQQANEGDTVSFSGSASDAGGVNDDLTIEWDFNYDGYVFQGDVSGTLTPPHQFTSNGQYLVALQVTDSLNETFGSCLFASLLLLSSL